MSLEKLVLMSNKYGESEDYVLAGGGNTSFKEDGVLYVKSSGTQLSTIKPEGFVKMNLDKLKEMLTKDYPADDNAREAVALADMYAARLPNQEDKRPSVEAILHGLFPYKYVLHVHPSLVNGLTCVKEGEELCSQLFEDKAVWVPLTKPGYILATTCYHLLEKKHQETGEYPKVVILQNHGIFAASNTMEEIDQIMDSTMSTLNKALVRKPDFTEISFDKERAGRILPTLRMLYSKEGKAVATFCTNKEVLNFVSDKNQFSKLIKPFSPDHIVYCKDEPLFIENDEDIIEAFEAYKEKKGYTPKIVSVKDLGFIALGSSKKESDIARLLFLDTIKIAVYGESFGQLNPMSHDLTNFILTWEIEQYRSKAAFATSNTKRLDGKIALVTGAAQGFGKGIATELVKEGATVIIADINLQGAICCSEELNTTYGKFSTIPLQVDVTSDQSVREMITNTVLAFGGLDLLISNAGVLVAGSIFEMTKEDFDFVTNVNYTGYFLCAKHVAPIMKIQNQVSPDYLTDIIEINSKSGLEGSNKNFAYAGSKFGGVGLTQSFALEFIEYGIKVNAICPGNLLDGPLWSDPEKGLFKQYLDAGKVKGATTIAEVRKFYESRVPMGRGCETLDVVRGILYIVEQQYETGQAIPVTGGQVMLS
jgi:rhamnose utilization protein RhaD (predicted bifunctional aldolase and dehydrogenase)/NAD(P)-dependent dehydrogenase (short-subunit alcohol dehydrogenase family)